MSDQAARHLTVDERVARGRAAREVHPPARQAELTLAPDRPEVSALLQEQARTRVPELVPLRHARMAVTPFTFFRGSARAMALDLASSPTSGLRVQLCGDAHLSNFGLFGSPERRLLLDVNDFDETLPGPWEWDVKRLAASLAVAGRGNDYTASKRRKIVVAAVRRYRDAMERFAHSRTLEVWYSRLEVEALRDLLSDQMSAKQRKNLDAAVTKARASDSLKAFSKLAETVDGTMRIRSDPPVVVPVRELLPDLDRADLEAWMRVLLREYAASLPRERRHLLDRFESVDLARKVVGVGSVGTRCWIVLLRGRDDRDPLFLQVKEAQPSVLADLVPPDMVEPDAPDNQGERVVTGQRMMQASSDIFLGWQRVHGIDGQQRDFYVRQLRDMKGSAVVEQMPPSGMRMYGEVCGWTLARAHARSGDPVAISAYLGDDDTVPEAMAEFAEAYADLTERDHAAMVEALRAGTLEAMQPA
ncbi:DUF2252 domain-containing protein [Nocardioides sp. MAHUQ-72]|uniref:DUF2252 domain-containing protein n=1 Tax=unclassified Nocardioides TaxID=2615069 RepID=UPI003612CCD1